MCAMEKDNLNESIYWKKETEILPRSELEGLQLKRLRETITRAKAVPFYNEKLKATSFYPDRIASIDSIRTLPFITKGDLRNQFPYGLLAVPLEDCIRVYASSGTTGRAVAVLHTENDIERWSNLVVDRCLYGVGGRKSDIFQNMADYGLFKGGMGFHYGAQKLGALTIPI